MITKRIEFSYPTSPHAERHGFGDVGCYTVQLIQTPDYPRDVRVFGDPYDAVAFAKTLPEPWDQCQCSWASAYLEQQGDI